MGIAYQKKKKPSQLFLFIQSYLRTFTHLPLQSLNPSRVRRLANQSDRAETTEAVACALQMTSSRLF